MNHYKGLIRQRSIKGNSPTYKHGSPRSHGQSLHYASFVRDVKDSCNKDAESFSLYALSLSQRRPNRLVQLKRCSMIRRKLDSLVGCDVRLSLGYGTLPARLHKQGGRYKAIGHTWGHSAYFLFRANSRIRIHTTQEMTTIEL